MMARSDSPQHILVYIGPHGDDAIGENLIKLPFLRAIATACPDAEITWTQGHDPLKFQSSLEPLVRGLIAEVLPDTVLGNTWGAALNPFKLLPGRHFNLIIDTQKNPMHTLCLRRVSHDVFISSAWRFAFSSRRPKRGKLGSGTLAERLLQLLELAIGGLERPDSKAVVPDEFRQAAAQALPVGPLYVGLAPGAGRQDTGKCWPLENFINVAKNQIEKGRTPVFFLGPEEGDWHDRIVREIPDARFAPLELNGLSGPTLTIALGAHLAVGVANCSGTGHMLAAGGSPMVSLYGPTNPKKFAPYTKDISIVKAQDFGGRGIELIPLVAVVEAIDSQIDG